MTAGFGGEGGSWRFPSVFDCDDKCDIKIHCVVIRMHDLNMAGNTKITYARHEP